MRFEIQGASILRYDRHKVVSSTLELEAGLD